MTKTDKVFVAGRAHAQAAGFAGELARTPEPRSGEGAGRT
jgi:hypothetical protein